MTSALVWHSHGGKFFKECSSDSQFAVPSSLVVHLKFLGRSVKLRWFPLAKAKGIPCPTQRLAFPMHGVQVTGECRLIFRPQLIFFDVPLMEMFSVLEKMLAGVEKFAFSSFRSGRLLLILCSRSSHLPFVGACAGYCSWRSCDAWVSNIYWFLKRRSFHVDRGGNRLIFI